MKKHSLFLILIVFTLFIGGCEYDFILPDYVPPIAAGVSFSEKVAPIFSTGDKCTSCHNGGISPDLTQPKVYSEIVPALVNTGNPEESKILTHPVSSEHGGGQKPYTSTEYATILTWIQEGAKNN